MKNIFYNGFFGVLLILIVGFIGITENTSETFDMDLNDQRSVDLTVEAVPVQYVFDVSDLSIHPKLSENFYVVSISDVSSGNEIKIDRDPGTNSVPLHLDGLRDETLS